MRWIVISAAVLVGAFCGAVLSLPVKAQDGFELQVRCAPLMQVEMALAAAGYRVVARGVDRDGDAVRLYRTGDSKWVLVSVMKGPDDAALGCPVLGGARMAVGDFGPGA